MTTSSLVRRWLPLVALVAPLVPAARAAKPPVEMPGGPHYVLINALNAPYPYQSNGVLVLTGYSFQGKDLFAHGRILAYASAYPIGVGDTQASYPVTLPLARLSAVMVPHSPTGEESGILLTFRLGLYAVGGTQVGDQFVSVFVPLAGSRFTELAGVIAKGQCGRICDLLAQVGIGGEVNAGMNIWVRYIASYDAPGANLLVAPIDIVVAARVDLNPYYSAVGVLRVERFLAEAEGVAMVGQLTLRVYDNPYQQGAPLASSTRSVTLGIGSIEVTTGWDGSGQVEIHLRPFFTSAGDYVVERSNHLSVWRGIPAVIDDVRRAVSRGVPDQIAHALNDLSDGYNINIPID